MRDNPVPPGYGTGPQAPGPGPQQPSAPSAGPDPRGLLFTPGPRLGWMFRDRRELAVPYQEPQPNPQLIQSRAAARTQAAEAAWQRAWRWVGKPSIALALILVLLAACSRTVSGSTFNPVLTVVTIVLLCAPGLGYTGWKWLQRDQSRDAPPEQEYQRALAEWDERATQHEGTELARLAHQPEWGSVIVPARRTDVFGGTLAGWQALIAVHGASIVAQRPLLIADLTRQYPAGLLMSLTAEMRIPSVTYRLPADLGRSGILNDLSPGQLADAVAEAIHAGAPGGARTERAIDVRVLNQLAGVLSPHGVTAQRLAAAVSAALGQGYSAADSLLSAEERDAISGELFPPGYREGVAASLVRLDAVLAELAANAGAGWPTQPARCTCLAMDAGARSASGDVLTALVAQWLTVQASAATGEQPAVIVAGADEITRAHAERLADACELRGTPLTLLFRHLRDDAAALLGGGTAAFMRLGNHHEAEQAAGYLGRRHTYVMSSRTATRGNSQTATSGGSEGHGDGESTGGSRAKNWQGGGFLGIGGDSSGGKTKTTGTSTSRNWGTSWSNADGNTWSDAATRQRVYEYRVEPSVLQSLPEFALLLAERSDNALRLRAVECDPSIVTLREASTGPLPPPGSTGAYRPTAPPAVGNAGNAGYPAGPAIAPPVQRPDAWPTAQGPAPEAARRPGEQQDVPWWLRNQPPDQPR